MEMKMCRSKESFLLFLSLVLILKSESSPDLRGYQVQNVQGKFILGDEDLAPLGSPSLFFASAAGQHPDGNGSESNLSLILAQHRTNRPDILNGFKRYRLGWDFTNKHYWASVGFTGVPAFAVGSIWFFSFGLSLVVLRCCKWNTHIWRKSFWRSRWTSLILLFIFTCIAIIGCVLLSVGQDGFQKEVSYTLDFVVNQSDFTVQSLQNVSDYLSLAKTINIEQIYLPPNDQSAIDKLDGDLSRSAYKLNAQMDENSERVRKARNAVRCTLVVMAIAMLLLSLLGLLLSILRYRHAIYIFILIAWLLVGITFIICGAFVIVNNAITDTCVSMKEWVENPQAESALSNVLPCVNETTTNQTLYQSKQIIRHVVEVVNKAIETTANSDSVPQTSNFYYNQSGPRMPTLCRPFVSQLGYQQCRPGEVSFSNASQVWQNYTCMVSTEGICISPGRVTPHIHQQLVTAVNVSYALYHYTPFLLSLQNCNFVRDSFSIITASYCPGLEHQLKLVIAGLVLISIGVLLCLVLWLLYANRHPRKEVFVKTSVTQTSADSPTTVITHP